MFKILLTLALFVSGMTYSSDATAKTFKLGDGDSGVYSQEMCKNCTNKPIVPKVECIKDKDCSIDQKCNTGTCVDLCPDASCIGETPNCKTETHTSYCACDISSCPVAYKCDGRACVACNSGEKCNCEGDAVADGVGSCRDPIELKQIECNNICGGDYAYDRPGAKKTADGQQEEVCTAKYKLSCGYDCTTAWDIDYLRNGTKYTCQRPLQCGDKAIYNNVPASANAGKNPANHSMCQELSNDSQCVKICGTDYVYDRPGAKKTADGQQEEVCTAKYKLSCGYDCTTGWDIDYLRNGTKYTCQRPLQCGDKAVYNLVNASANAGKNPANHPMCGPTITDDKNADCVRFCGASYKYDRAGAKTATNGMKERVCTADYKLSCGYDCTTGWDINYLVQGTPYTCQRPLQCGDKAVYNYVNASANAGKNPAGHPMCVSDDKDADCIKYCGSGYYYDRPGAKLSGKERVCTKYPLSCGYNCTTGWDIQYLVKGTVYTCQKAIQTVR